MNNKLNFLKKNEEYLNEIKDTEWINKKLNENVNNIKELIIKNEFKYKYFYYPNILSNTLCDYIINENEKYASLNISNLNPTGWTTTRHENYPTTDLPLNNILSLKTLINNIIRTDIFELISKSYNVNKYFLDCNDIFIVKYSHDKQNKLEKHQDGSIFSFNILLNSPESFEGGGTNLEQKEGEILLENTKGGLIIHCGRCFHKGNEIKSGKRYLLVGFISYLKNNLILSETNRINIIKPLKFEKIINKENKVFNNDINLNSYILEFNEDYETNLIKNTQKMTKLQLLDKKKFNFTYLEKFIYEMSNFHLEKIDENYDINDYYIEYWTKYENYNKNIIHNFHSDKDENEFKQNNTFYHPILSTITYLSDSLYPTIITSISEDKKNNLINLNSDEKNIIFIFSEKFKHISFNGKYIHGVSKIFQNILNDELINNKPRQTIMFNIWKRKPLNIEFSNIDLNDDYIEKNAKILKNIDIYNNDSELFKLEENKINIILNNFIQNKCILQNTQYLKNIFDEKIKEEKKNIIIF